MPDRIDLSPADDPRDAIHRAVACLAAGELVALATDFGYGLIGSALQPAALDHLRSAADLLLRPESEHPANQSPRPLLLLRAAEELADWVDLPSPSVQRLPGRIWPGPVLRFRAPAAGLVSRLPAPLRTWLVPEDQVSFQIPSNRPLRELSRLTLGPIALVDGSCAPARRRLDWAALAGQPGVGLIVATGDSAPAYLPTVVAVTADRWEVVQPGDYSERVLAERLATMILFICTGNTCRSPMAEALCRAILTRKLGCQEEELVDRGWLIVSAGVAASDGMPAASHAIDVVGRRGGSLVEHSSQSVTAPLVQRADHILAMTWDHLDALLDQAPGAADRVRLLDPAGGDIADPVGMDQQTYLETAQAIEAHLEALLRELGL